MENKEFCIRDHKLLIIAVVAILIVVIIWAVYQQIYQPASGCMAGNRAFAQRVAAPAANGMIPISIGQAVPHANYGNNCMQCHVLNGTDQKPAINAMPITTTATMPHPYWGECSKCHKILPCPGGGQGRNVALTTGAVSGRNLMGAELLTVTPELAAQYKMPTKGGVLVNVVERGSTAETAGFQQGDIIISIDNQTVDHVSTLTGFLLTKVDGDKLKFKVMRDGGKTLNIKMTFSTADFGGTIGTDSIGILAASSDINGPVAYSLNNATYLIVYNVANDTFESIRNPNRGLTNSEVSDWIKTKNVGAVVVGNLSDTDLQNLANSNVKVYSGVFGNVKDAVILFKQGNLVENQSATASQVGINLRDINTIAIPANYPDPSANVATNFATAKYFIVVELDQNKYEVKTNPTYNDMSAGGIRSTHFLVDEQVDAVVASSVEINALTEMKNLNMHFARCGNSTVGDAIMAFKNGKLRLEF